MHTPNCSYYTPRTGTNLTAPGQRLRRGTSLLESGSESSAAGGSCTPEQALYRVQRDRRQCWESLSREDTMEASPDELKSNLAEYKGQLKQVRLVQGPAALSNMLCHVRSLAYC
eukprot:389329-Pelagomonas_calceolata.AAC.5